MTAIFTKKSIIQINLNIDLEYISDDKIQINNIITLSGLENGNLYMITSTGGLEASSTGLISIFNPEFKEKVQ